MGVGSEFRAPLLLELETPPHAAIPNPHNKLHNLGANPLQLSGCQAPELAAMSFIGDDALVALLAAS
jgi:hypothetical protein